jgi:hypothetical protein
VGEASGGTEPVLLFGYQEDDPSDCSLGETLESLIPLIWEVDTTVPLTIHQGNHILSLPSSTDLVNFSELCVGGQVLVMLGLKDWDWRPP